MTQTGVTSAAATASTGVAKLFPPTQGLLGRPNPTGRTHWGTRFGYFGTDRILRTYLTGTEVLALRFTTRTRFGALDLDAGSLYHTPATVAALFAAAAARNLTLTLCRSSESGGWHVYLWAEEFVAISAMHATLRSLAEAAGITRFENGTCEVYPDPQHAKQAFRLPAQAGFAWLTADTTTVIRACQANDGSANLAALASWVSAVAVPVERIAAAAEHPATTPEPAQMPRGRPPKIAPPPRASDGLPDAAILQLQRALVYRYDRNAARAGKPAFTTTGMPRFREGARLFAVGLERPGSRNAALQLVSFYLFFCGYTRAADRELLLLLWLSARHNGHSTAWVDATRRSEIEVEIRRMATWRPTSGAISHGARQAKARERATSESRIAAALATLGGACTSATVAQIAKAAGVSGRTVSRILPSVVAKIMSVQLPVNSQKIQEKPEP